ncbi:PAS domain S-box-containing protein/diguanylate cyclase (GGDEF)-like protein [Chromohalobacter marismortui]|uniref:PAS domain S-box-containing protein/diguanylate cyclase (GGDEF)-like protein n=1 Tax=Chromohalobacter marismortui TaxID=42055 RepID=A0A4R7NXC3_9GAMM|nr:MULTISPECIES: diguanylate cyclase [Chromohalobacter]MCI0511155.1 diguanylate cyclase [Chromohalobacter sp.]MCI0593609.1 diguanylate cyclase [Chromohalobacter sp.]TDU25180.1 PAS domain S-box-containing protein/diguanylate cyclase (GGDEF)-like protein [Chromohalobacter marismortui]
MLPGTLLGRLVLGLSVGWCVLVVAILWVSLRGGSDLADEINRAHLNYESELIARNIQQSISLRLETLGRIADSPVSALQVGKPLDQGRPDDVQARLNAHSALMTLFDSAFVTDAQGDVLAFSPKLPGAVGLNVADREYFRFIQEVGRPFVGRPIISKLYDKRPLIVMGVPLTDAQGRFAGMLGGVVNLRDGRFFLDLRSLRIGQEGYAVLMTSDATVLSHPDPNRVMQDTPAAWEGPLLEKALDGWQGTGTGRLVDGQPALMSFHQVWRPGWIVGVFLPQSQIHQPIVDFVRRQWWVAVVVVLSMLPLLWWLLRLGLSPLRRLARQIAQVGQGDITRITLDTSLEELRRIAQTFNSVEHARSRERMARRSRQAYLDAVLRSSPLPMFLADLNGRITYVNPALESLTRLSAAAFQHRAWLRRLHPEDRSVLFALWRDALNQGHGLHRQLRFQCGDRGMMWLELYTSQVMNGDQPQGVVGFIKDITHLRAQQKRQLWEAEHDPLTGLLNRRGFDRRLSETFQRFSEHGDTASLILFDLDSFKPINDEGGHALGDEMLRAIARCLEGCVRRDDHLARLGGDEFAILLPGCGHAQAVRIADQVRQAVSQLSVVHADTRYRVTASLGVSCLRADDDEAQAVVKRADAASYEAKAQGKNRMVADARCE